jgi:transposase
VAIEAGNQTMWIYEILEGMGAEVTVVNPTKVKAIAESRRKTDKIDAKILCDLLRLDGLPQPVHMPGREARELRGILVARRQLISARTKLCNVIRGMLRQEGIRLPMRALSSQIGWDRLLKRKYCLEHIRPMIESYARSFTALSESIKELDHQLQEREKSDERVERLKTIPNVGSISSLTLVAALDDVHRFSSSRKVVSYSGLAPTVDASGERVVYGPISREGRSEIRAAWVQVAHRMAYDRRVEARPLRKWFNRVARRRGKKTATVALARKILTIAYQMLKEGESYNAARIGAAG